VQLDKLFIPITLLGDSLMLTGMALLLALAWWYRGHRAAASHLLLAVAAISIINHLLKEGAGISRPELLLNPIASFSFPSAHTSTSTLFFYLMAAFIAQKQKPENRWIPYSLFTLPVLAIGVSRLYLGAHWLSDIIGGLMLGLAACAAVRLSYSAFDRVPIRLGNTLWSLLLGWAFWALLYIYWHYEPALAQYQPLTS
jgi:undecaprenyl-diphosphatase